MSKVIWQGFATGVLNAGEPIRKRLPHAWNLAVCIVHALNQRVHRCAGLLSTEAGTLGRFSGNAYLWAVGKFAGLEREQMPRFAGLLFTGMAGVCGALLALMAVLFRRLKG